MNKYVLISVYNKEKLEVIAPIIVKYGYKIVATPGTGKKLKNIGINFCPVNKLTKNPNGLEDCIQTISYSMSAGILFDRNNPKHIKKVLDYKIKPIEIVFCNYPPLELVIKCNKDFSVKNIDVGGPLMVRAAATNFKYVLPVVDPKDYETVAQRIQNNSISETFRRSFAIKAYKYCSDYDADISSLLKNF